MSLLAPIPSQLNHVACTFSLFLVRLAEPNSQATLEAELDSFRGRLEEKDGLITALREALRSAATQQTPTPTSTTTTQQGGAATTLDASGAVSHIANGHHHQDTIGTAESTPKNTPKPKLPLSADGRAVVPGRGVFAPLPLPLNDESIRSHGRYHSRSSRLMGAQGPVAAAEAAARHTAVMSVPGGGASSGSSLVHVGSDAREDGQASAEDVRKVEVAPDHDYAGPVFQANDNDGSSHGEAPASMTARDISRNVGAVESAALLPPSNGTLLGTQRKSTGASSSRRASPTSVTRRKRNAKDEGYMDIVSQATAVTGSALRTLWNSAWVAGSRVGSRLDGGGGAETYSGRENSSHAVLIL